MRLVPDQDWKKSVTFYKHFKAIAPAGVKLGDHSPRGYALCTPTDTLAYQAAHQAYHETFGVVPIPSEDGGSIPIVPMFEKESGSKIILMGFGLDY